MAETAPSIESIKWGDCIPDDQIDDGHPPFVVTQDALTEYAQENQQIFIDALQSGKWEEMQIPLTRMNAAAHVLADCFYNGNLDAAKEDAGLTETRQRANGVLLEWEQSAFDDDDNGEIPY